MHDNLNNLRDDPPPDHVLAAFGLRDSTPKQLRESWENGWKCGEIVLSPVSDLPRAAWSAKVRESLHVEGIRLSRPIGSTDGRFVVAGWCANTFISGHPAPRYDEIISSGVRLHEVLAKLDRPRFLAQSPITPWGSIDIFAAADHAAWEAKPFTALQRGNRLQLDREDIHQAMELIDQLARLRTQTTSPNQVVHGDLYKTVVFAGTAAPGIIDITPYWRPAGWAIALAVIDALTWGEADDELIERWAQFPEWPQMLLRALLFRLAIHVLNPYSNPESLYGLWNNAELLRFIL